MRKQLGGDDTMQRDVGTIFVLGLSEAVDTIVAGGTAAVVVVDSIVVVFATVAQVN